MTRMRKTKMTGRTTIVRIKVKKLRVKQSKRGSKNNRNGSHSLKMRKLNKKKGKTEKE